MGRDIDISLQQFACHLHLSCEGVDIYNVDLHDFEYPDGESAHTASTLLHDDENPDLVRNEKVEYYTLTRPWLRSCSITSCQNQKNIVTLGVLLLLLSIAF